MSDGPEDERELDAQRMAHPECDDEHGPDCGCYGCEWAWEIAREEKDDRDVMESRGK